MTDDTRDVIDAAELRHLRADLAEARAMVPRCGSISLLDVVHARKRNEPWQDIADRAGVSKGAAWQAARRARALMGRVE